MWIWSNKLSIPHLSFFSFQKLYETFNQAHRDAKEGKILGLVYLTKDFSKNLPRFEEFLNSKSEKPIQVHLDNTDAYKVIFFKMFLFSSLRSFMKEVTAECQLPEGFFDPPIHFESLFGTKKMDMKSHYGVSFLITYEILLKIKRLCILKFFLF
jgi:hypothetical protein